MAERLRSRFGMDAGYQPRFAGMTHGFDGAFFGA